MKPDFTYINGLRIRIAKNERKEATTVLFFSPLPQSILFYDNVWSRLSGVANLVAVDLPGFVRSGNGYKHTTFEAPSAFLEQFINT